MDIYIYKLTKKLNKFKYIILVIQEIIYIKKVYLCDTKEKLNAFYKLSSMHMIRNQMKFTDNINKKYSMNIYGLFYGKR